MAKLSRSEYERINDLIRSELSDLDTGLLTEQEKKASLERIEKLVDIRNKSEKREKRWGTILNVVKIVVEIGGVALGFATLARKTQMYYDGLNFEKTGTICSPHVKGQVNYVTK